MPLVGSTASTLHAPTAVAPSPPRRDPRRAAAPRAARRSWRHRTPSCRRPRAAEKHGESTSRAQPRRRRRAPSAGAERCDAGAVAGGPQVEPMFAELDRDHGRAHADQGVAEVGEERAVHDRRQRGAALEPRVQAPVHDEEQLVDARCEDVDDAGASPSAPPPSRRARRRSRDRARRGRARSPARPRARARTAPAAAAPPFAYIAGISGG